ncbi:hypothetical protein DYB30_000371 [Aphanomyces astaci]|nr:hypothetical protein DYB38_000094 [Aphanomyces astaci]RHY76310.1 hypothetical protein DYB30_000371 [Aphanomyces astaci]
MFPVTILLEDAYVSDLQKAIVTEMKDVDVLPAKVKLYLARKQGEWLRGGYDLEAFLQAGVSSEYPKMLPLWKLTMPELFGSNFEPAVNVIHVLVALPSEPPSKKAKVDSSGVGLGGSIVGTNHAQPPQATWKPDVPPAFCLLNDDMFFVDRDDAVKQLQEIHRHTYIRAVCGRGLDWVIPLADNVDLDKPTDFHKTLMRCHTVRLVFKSGAMVESSFDAVLIHLLVRQLRDMFEVPPAILLTPPPSVVDFLELLTDEVGPLFIALDEIGAAFTSDSWTDLKSRDRLMAFCRAIVGNWLLIPNVLFVLLGRGPFLGLKVVTEMLTVIKCGESTNLTSQVKDPGGKLISLNQIASNCCIAWQGTVVEVDDVLLTLGLAVKNYSTAKVSQGTLASECDEFNRMFDGCAAEPKRLNVLVVCATKYDKGFSDEFGNRKAMVAPSDAYPNIAQVILLNLSTPDNRAEFFGLNDAPDLASMLEKRIAKGEVEFNNLVQRTSKNVNRMLQALRSGPTSCSKANQEPSANDASSGEDGTRDDDDDGDLVTQRHYWDEGGLENEVEIQVVEAKLAELYHASLSDSVVDAKTRDRHHREGKRLEECKAAYLAERHKLHAGGQDDWLATHRISKDVLVEVLERLGMPVSAAEVEDMVWEVNDGLDGAVSWDEYKRSFLRCKHDKTCLEPTLLFHITCFVMYDRDCSGKVSMDDAMHMLFLKYGNHMEAEMEALFGKRLRDDEFVMTLTFPQVCKLHQSHCIHVHIGSTTRSRYVQ